MKNWRSQKRSQSVRRVTIIRPIIKEKYTMQCRMLKKSELSRPLPSAPDPAASPGEYGVVDNGDGTCTVVVLDPAGNASPIDPGAAAMTASSGEPNVVEVEKTGDFTFRERVAHTTAPAPPKATTARAPSGHTTPQALHPSSTQHSGPGSGAVANISVTVTWAGPTPAAHTLTWKDTVTHDPSGTDTLARDQATVV